MGNKFYTPDGFNDQFPGICGVKRELESKLACLLLTQEEKPGKVRVALDNEQIFCYI